ncbi:AAA family ATPase [Rubrivirga sp. SAORIC476]|uniref:AAA family ATPase n=1 Tax=Rubrivirga sp. SAORIC476 TaxID=1961794 RepID=UPI00130462B9|nr:AAA family ATPase [Rubrivirga sp. SAORIC476]
MAVRSPVTAVVLDSLGIRACAFESPARTLCSADALRSLLDLGVLTPFDEPEVVLIVADTTAKLSPEGASLLKGLFSKVIEAPHLESAEFLQKVGGHGGGGSLEHFLLAKAERGRVRHESPHVLPSEKARPEKRRGKSLLEIAEGDPVEWVVPGLAASGTVTDLIGEPKAGKTTLALEAARAVAEGRDFLGEPTVKGPVVYVSEQSEPSLRGTLDRMGWMTQDVIALTVEDHWDLRFDEVLLDVYRIVRETGARLVVIDTLAAVAKLGGRMASAPSVRRLFAKVRGRLCEGGVAVVLVRHTTKRGAQGRTLSVSAAGSGSHAFAGEADHVVVYSVVEGANGLRHMQVRGRMTENADMIVEWTGNGVVKRPPSGSRPAADGAAGVIRDDAAREEAVLRFLNESPGESFSVKALLKAVKTSDGRTIKQTTLRTTLGRLEKRGEVACDHDGIRNLYSLGRGFQDPLSETSDVRGNADVES